MFWVVQENLFQERNHSRLLEALQQTQTPFVQVKLVPFFNRLLPYDFDSHAFHGSIDEMSEPFVDEKNGVYVSGAILLANIAKQRGWSPGSFLNENFHYSAWRDAYGENLLNFESIIDSFDTIDPPWDHFFLRPCEDTKSVPGEVFERTTFETWRKEFLLNPQSCPFLHESFFASPVKTIFRESRFFVVERKIITYSQYKADGKIVPFSFVGEETISFAQKMVDLWQPARAFVIDVAETMDGYKIVEINNINSAGFYDADVLKLVNAINLLT